MNGMGVCLRQITTVRRGPRELLWLFIYLFMEGKSAKPMGSVSPSLLRKFYVLGVIFFSVSMKYQVCLEENIALHAFGSKNVEWDLLEYGSFILK